MNLKKYMVSEMPVGILFLELRTGLLKTSSCEKVGEEKTKGSQGA